MSARAIVVLGCKLGVGAREGHLAGPSKRRVDAAAHAWNARASDVSLVVVTGGRMWNGVVEADALASALAEQGLPQEAILRERCSFHTGDNARFTAALLSQRTIDEIFLVTCDWHLPRARRAFERRGLRVHDVPAVTPPRSLRQRVWRWCAERVAERFTAWSVLAVVACLALLGVGCRKSESENASQVDASAAHNAAQGEPAEWGAIARAEDLRRAADVTEAMIAHPDTRVRRRAARALARIADDASVAGLMHALADPDETVAAWGAYGLGYACKGKEDAHVAALAARAVSLGDAKPSGALGGEDDLDLRWSIGRALGRCGGGAAESRLIQWVRARGVWAEGAAYGLGDFAGRDGSLSDEATAALLDVAPGGTAGAPEVRGSAATDLRPVLAALFGFGRIKRLPERFAPRLVEAARGALNQAAPERIFAVRALGHAGPLAVPELAKVVRDRGFAAAERAEAARGLGLLDAPGRQAAVQALAALAPSQDPIALMALAGDEFGVLATLLDALHGEVPPGGEPALLTLAQLTAPGDLPPVLARRLAKLRCAAASALVKDAYNSDLLTRCDAKGSIAFERGRLAALLRGRLVTDRRDAWIELTKSANFQVREAALEAIGAHAELGDGAQAALAQALHSDKGGLVATAAEVIVAHPERVSKAEPGGRRPRVHPAVGAALKEALAVAWPEQLVETRIDLIEAAVAVGLEGAREAALRGCSDPNVTLRERAGKALVKLGGGAAPAGSSAPSPSSPPPLSSPAGASPAGASPAGGGSPVRLVLETDAGRLSLVVDPTLAPVTAGRVAALAESGFYKEMRVHRVVPGYVVQFGDPDGDGYGGSGRLLRCETSPVPFEPLTVGIALAGRDTGSSQIFVTLSRTPHLDGNYTRFGHAEGDWAAVAQDDVIHDVRVER